ncbi:MAG: hypothetical protein ABIO05_04360, partial [Ferruginibacter sp.]
MKSIFLQKKIIAAACLYFLISAGLLIIFGINVDGEANKVLENANCLLDGRELNNSVFSYFYVVYYLLVAFFIKLSASFVMVGVLQVILSFVAAAFLYRLLSNALQNEAIAYTFFIVYLLCY